MPNSSKTKKHLVSWILILLLLIPGCVLLFHAYSFSDASHRLFAKRIQNVVLQQSVFLQLSKTQILDAFDEYGFDAFQTLDASNSVGFYVFSKDSLAFWNSNLIETKLLRKRVNLNCDTIVNLNIGDFLVTSFTKDSYSFYLFNLLNTTYPIENKYFVNTFQPIFAKHKVAFNPKALPDSFPIYGSTGNLLSNCTIEFPTAWGSSNLAILIVCGSLIILCIYLLITRAITKKNQIALKDSSNQPEQKVLSKQNRIALLVVMLFMAVLFLFAYRWLFRYGFTQGFLIPSSMRLDYCFLFLFIGGLALVTFSLFCLWLLKPWLKQRNEFFVMIAQFVVWGILLTLLYDSEFNRFENREIEQLAKDLSNERDLAFEKSYPHFLSETVSDTVFLNMLCDDNVMEEVVLDYMRNYLLDSVMNQYVVSLTLCSPEQELFLQPYNIVSDCQGYFNEKIVMNRGLAIDQGLYFMDYNSLDPNYLAYLALTAGDTLRLKSIFVEFTKPVAPQGFGFPKMLQDEHNALLLRSSAACYRDSLLVYKFGSYVFPTYLSDYKHPAGEFSLTKKMKHYVHRIDDNTVLALCFYRQGLMETTSPFVVFFILLLVPYLLIYFVGGVKRHNPASQTLSNRFQVLVLVALGVSFMLISPISAFYLRNFYTQKANETHFDRTRSLLLDIINEVDLSSLKKPDFKNTLDDILRRYSETFFTDINIYDVDGKMLSTTCTELMDLQIQSSLMNPEAFHNMNEEKSLYFVHEEQLGKATFQSSYVSIQDYMGRTLAYLNIPYFSSQSDLQTDILYYILTYVNIILFIIFLFIPIVLHLTRQVTDPLEQLQQMMLGLDINKLNKTKKLEWKSNDEIGSLINQYNQLLVMLAESTAELKRTTTENAWRSVARQVAHEIKNPLTPMRLSVQLLQHNMENGADDLEDQVNRTANTLIEQIDTLSEIASSFSLYAKLPENHPQPLDLAELVSNVVNLYDNVPNIEFVFDYNPKVEHIFNGDKTNLNRAIGNIIKNATQAIGTKPNGKIEVSLQDFDTAYVISIKDNGKGIKEEDKGMIFVPNFTTKTSGSGLGLSMTYNNIQAAGGTISFESEEGVGTEFVIVLPK